MMLITFSKYFHIFFKEDHRPKDIEAANNLITYMKNIYANPHEFYEADISKYEKIDTNFYKIKTEEFINSGFNKIIDIEDVTITQNNPNMRTCIRYFSNKQGTINASCFHLNFGKIAKIFSIFTKNPANLYSIELETEFIDGSFIITNNLLESSKLIDYPESIVIHKYTKSTPLSTLIDSHTARIEATGKPIREVHGVEDIISVSDRMLMIKNRYMKSKGYANREMYQQIKGKHLSKKDEKFIEVLEEVKNDLNL